MQRYFADSKITTEYQLTPEIYKHAIKVLRMKVGDTFELVDDAEVVHKMEITKIEDGKAKATSVEVIPSDVELPADVTIACGISKNDKADWIVQKGTEMGATKFIFFIGDYSVAKWDKKRSSKKIQRLQKIARSAAEQSHRTKIPEVTFVEKLKDIDFEKNDARIVAYEESAKKGESGNLFKILNKKPSDIIAIFGPEGGISPKEIEFLEANSFILAGLGPRIMRAETAPLYFLASLSFALELS